mgnify:CR=1 FL=1
MKSEPQFPANGMTVQPMYFPSADWDLFHASAFFGLCEFLIGKVEIQEAFEKESGYCLLDLAFSSPLKQELDLITGRRNTIMAAFCDWVAINHWGVREGGVVVSAPCVTHHFACNCREALFSKTQETQRKVVEILSYSDEHMHSQFGELTVEEICLIRAVLNSIVGRSGTVTQ